MVLSEDITLPSDEELTVPEVKLSGPVLKAAAFHLGKVCEFENNEFVLCRKELNDPRKCLVEGKAVTNCTMNFFRSVKSSCATDFMQYANCIDKSSTDHSYTPCRKTQAALDKCMQENLGMERASFDYFSRVQVHKTERPRPPVVGPKHYPDATPHLPEDAPTPPAKYGSRYMFMN